VDVRVGVLLLVGVEVTVGERVGVFVSIFVAVGLRVGVGEIIEDSTFTLKT